MALFPGHDRVPDPRAGEDVEGLERFRHDTADASAEAWFVPARAGTGKRPALVFCHGNAELIDDWTTALAPVSSLGVHLLLPEYRGYGRTRGTPSEIGITEDCVAFVGSLAERDDVDPDRLVFVGRSLGGGVACALARRIRPRALVLMSTFTSARAMARRYLVPGFLVDDRFDNLDAVRRLDVPLWVVHGTRDDLVPVSHARALASAARDARLSLYDAGHNDCPPDWGVFHRELAEHLVRAGVLDAGAERATSR